MKRLREILTGLVLVLLAVALDKALEGKMERGTRSFVKGWAITALVIALLVIFNACAGNVRQYRAGRETVLVVNESLEQLAIYANSATRIGTVMSGRSECLYLPQSSSNIRLVARAIGGGIRYSPDFNPTRSWRWVVDITRNRDAIGLMEVEPCR